MECLELLINEFHCDINTKDAFGRTILHNACAEGHINLLRALVLKYGCDCQDVHSEVSNMQMIVEKIKRIGEVCIAWNYPCTIDLVFINN